MRKIGAGTTIASFVAGALLFGAVPTRATTGHSDWNQYLGNNHHSSFSPASVITVDNADSLQQAWTWTPPTYPDRSEDGVEVTPVVHDGVVYVGAMNGHMYALDESTGTPLWGEDGVDLGSSNPCPSGSPGIEQGIGDTATVSYDPVLGDEVIYVQSGPGSQFGPTDSGDVAGASGGVYLNALETDGTLLWRVRVARAIGSFGWASPVVFGGHVYVGLASWGDCPLVRGGIKEFDQRTGRLVHIYWASPRGTVGDGVWTTPATNGRYLWVTTGNGRRGDAYSIVRLSTDLSKVERWRAPVRGDHDFGSSPVLFSAVLNGTPTALVGGVAKNGYLYAFDRRHLAAGPVWSQRVAVQETWAAPVWDGQHLLVAGTRTSIGGVGYPGSVRRLDPATGDIMWERGLPEAVAGTPTVDAAGVVAVATFGAQNEFDLLDAGNGTILTSSTGVAAEFGQPVFIDDVLLQATQTSVTAWKLETP